MILFITVVIIFCWIIIGIYFALSVMLMFGLAKRRTDLLLKCLWAYVILFILDFFAIIFLYYAFNGFFSALIEFFFLGKVVIFCYTQVVHKIIIIFI